MTILEQKKPRKQHVKTDVLVVGAGITGLLCSYFLKKAQIAHQIIDSGTGSPSQFSSAGLVSAYPREHLTRMVHAYGREVGKGYLSFQEQGWQDLQILCRELGLPLEPLPALRIAVAEHEVNEMQAANLLHSEFSEKQALLQSEEEFSAFGLNPEKVKTVQLIGARAAILDAPLFYEKLETLATASANSSPILRGTVTKLEETPHSVIAYFQDGSSLQAQMVILATHIGIRSLRPEFHDIAIPIVEQWETLQLTQDTFPKLSSYLFTANYGYYWGAVDLQNRRLRLGGARFLRHHAGIGHETAEVSKDIQKHLIQFAKSVWNVLVDESSIGPSHVGLDCQPCDELPVIGPLPGSGRLLTCFGYNGNGYSLAMAGAKAITEIIEHGQTETLPKFMRLERFRALKD